MRDARGAEREYRVMVAAAQIDSRHVMPLVDHQLDTDAFYLVMPRATSNLRTYLDNHGPLDLPTVWQIFEDLAHGLADLDQAGLLHRDIKPTNALHLDNRWVWGDVGLGRFRDEATATETFAGFGTLEYRAPELFRGNPHSFQTDLYALGCTIAEIVNPVPPVFSVSEPAQRHLHEEPDFSGIPDARLVHILRSTLLKSPGGRPHDSEAFARHVNAARAKAQNRTNQPTTSAPGPAAALTTEPGELSPLQRLEERSLARRQAQDAATARQLSFVQAGDDAMAILQRTWDELLLQVEEEVLESSHGHDMNTWWLDVGDWRLLITTDRPTTSEHEAVLLGEIKVADYGTLGGQLVSNLVATRHNDGHISWKIVSFEQATIPQDKVPHENVAVTPSPSGTRGALQAHDLERVLTLSHTNQKGYAPVLITERELTAPALIEVLYLEAQSPE
jgi:serine/threonine protein kinase